MEVPRIISVDDHVLEPPDLWTCRLSSSARTFGPHVVREKGAFVGRGDASPWIADPNAPGAAWADVWRYDDLEWPLVRGYAYSGFEGEDALRAITYDDVRPGTYERGARLADMDSNHTEASICFPTMPRFCGQTFMERRDKGVALLAVKAYNDWMIDEWCGPARPARLIPLTLIPLWDPALAAAEVRRSAAKGSHAIAFSESPPQLDLPSIYSDHWDPLFEACQETDTVINMHVGSSSKLMTTADDAPGDMMLCLLYVNALLAFTDWLYSGTLQLFPGLKIALSESQVGWIPFAVQRIDNTWKKGKASWRDDGTRRAKELPSSVMPGRVFGCVFDDSEGLRNRNAVGMRQILYETDYPHTDSTFPNSEKVVGELIDEVGLSAQETYQLVRGGAIEAYDLDKYFGIE